MPKCELVGLDFVDRATIVATAEVTVAESSWGPSLANIDDHLSIAA